MQPSSSQSRNRENGLQKEEWLRAGPVSLPTTREPEARDAVTKSFTAKHDKNAKSGQTVVFFNRSSTGGFHGSQSHESQQDAEEKAHEGIGQEAARAAGKTGEEAEKRE